MLETPTCPNPNRNLPLIHHLPIDPPLIRYGHKANAVEMLREWVHTVGIAAGLDPTHVSLLTGAIGSPESSVEMEIAGFGNMAGEFLFIFVVWAN